ncbi:MAG TPA: hypothetical protein DCZ40_04690 [Lachnospiraceae bacterium]|nr:hypothetical protein [Lachnospiraceae bacterium]
MSKTIQSGGMGKNPAIEKINQLNAVSSRMQAAAELEKRALHAKKGRMKEVLEKRKRIVEEYAISFKKGRGNESSF